MFCKLRSCQKDDSLILWAVPSTGVVFRTSDEGAPQFLLHFFLDDFKLNDVPIVSYFFIISF